MSCVNDLSSKTFKRAEVNVQGKLSNYFLTHYSHFLVPGLNASATNWIDHWEIDSITKLQKEFPYNCELPRPLLPPVRISKDDADPAINLVITKEKVNDSVNRFLDYYGKNKKSFASVPLKKDTTSKAGGRPKQVSIPKYVADLAMMMEMDPDPNFSGEYNWYYTGGSLDTVTLGGENLLLFPYMDDLVAAPINFMPHAVCKPNLYKGSSCKTNGTIYELKTCLTDDACRILGRSKNCCTFYSVMEKHGKLEMIQVHEQHSDVPYVSAGFEPMKPNKFCTLNVERTVTMWDMVSNKKVASNTIEASKVLENKWGSVRYAKSEPNTLVFMDSCCIHHLDTRQPFEKPALTLCIKDHLNSCESLCLEVPSRNENYSYVGTYHSLLICDRRVRQQECVQQRWTHQFKSAPLLGAVQTRDKEEIVVLCSQLADETTIILNDWSTPNSFSHCMPYTPPTIIDTLRNTQLHGKCLDPRIRRRVEASNCGVAMSLNDKGDATLFLQNSIGDVFYQGITQDKDLDKLSLARDQSNYAMECWERQILLQDRALKPLTVTDRLNMHHTFDGLNDKSLIYRHSQSHGLLRDPKWKQSTTELESYVDILAPELLAVWDVSSDVPSTQPTVPHQKVMNWLEMAGQKYSLPSQEEPDLDFDIKPTGSTIRQMEAADVGENTLSETYYPQVKVKSGRTQTVKKRTYVAGF